MDIELLIVEIPKALGLDIAPHCRKFWLNAIEQVCRNKKIAKCRFSTKNRLILIAEDGTEDGCSVNDLKNPILRKVAQLKKAANISIDGMPELDDEPKPSETNNQSPSDDAYWIKFRRALEDGGKKVEGNGKNLFIDKIEDWDLLRDQLLTQLTRETYFQVKGKFKDAKTFAEAVKASILKNQPEINVDMAETFVNMVIKAIAENVLVSW